MLSTKEEKGWILDSVLKSVQDDPASWSLGVATDSRTFTHGRSSVEVTLGNSAKGMKVNHWRRGCILRQRIFKSPCMMREALFKEFSELFRKTIELRLQTLVDDLRNYHSSVPSIPITPDTKRGRI
jgi:hypothetical protein